MDINYEVINSAATLVTVALATLPIDDEIRWRRLDDEDAEALRALLAELTKDDITNAVRAAAARLAEGSE